jgi:hypothetical protein
MSPPEVLPIFPLAGVVLLPGGRLPLHVFELRYRNMIEDALEGDRYIGIVQPVALDDEILADQLPSADDELPAVYGVGCAGAVERCETLADGRYVILLHGERRFRVRAELELHRGYRRVEAAYEEFADDERVTTAALDAERLLTALEDFGTEHRLVFETDKLRQLPPLALLNSVAMTLPFPPVEKQALLEAPSVEDRFETLITLLGMGIDQGDGPSPATLN